LVLAWSGFAQATPDPACPEGYWCPPADASRVEENGVDATNSSMQFNVSPPAPPVPRRRLHALSIRLTQLFGSGGPSKGDHLTGMGLSYRVRPSAWLGVEPAIDLMRGYDGYSSVRSETHIGTDLLFYLNPRDAVQFFGLAGASLWLSRHSAHWAHANSSYLGAQLGLGLEFRVTHRISFNVNGVGYSRRLTGAELRQSAASAQAELVPDATHGLMLRAGGGWYF
jgi:hypothetical protein